MHLTKFVYATALMGIATWGHATELYNNGAVVNSSGLSILTSPDTTYGSTSSSTANYGIADNFTVTGAGWNISSVDVYAYQTGAVGFTFTGVTYSIVMGTNVNTGTVVASGTVAAVNDGLAGYRVLSTATTGTTRAIYKIGADIPDITLAAGSYFLTWALAGTGTSGPFVPPVVASLGTGNALQSASGAGGYVAVADAGSLSTFDVPFTITGTVVAVPEPETTALLLAGLGGIALKLRRSRKV